MINDRHVRISADGRVEELEAVEEIFVLPAGRHQKAAEAGSPLEANLQLLGEPQTL
jgi:hypothetical protein